MRIGVLFIIFLSSLSLWAQGDKKEEGKDWIALPAIGEGLCVNNIFQSNMVLQREKAVKIWGWATPGEEIMVSFAGQSHTTKAEKDRSWKVKLTAMEANSKPQTLTGRVESSAIDSPPKPGWR